MSMWLTMAVLLLAVFLVVLTLLQRRSQGSGVESTGNDLSLSREGLAAFLKTDTMLQEVWWKKLSSLHQQQLALYLVEKAMPLWKNFTSSQVVSYRDATAGPFIIIESDLLQRTVEAMFFHLQSPFPKGDSKKLHQYHSRFIGPVLALKDGIWICNYPVKKLFLSVYFILMSMVEQANLNGNSHCLSAVIIAVLECLELSKLYTPEEVASFLETYRCGLQQG